MLSYIVRRVVSGVVLAVLVTFITFLLLSTSFESVARTMLGQAATKQSVLEAMHKLGYDRPILVQYGDWLAGALHGDFGSSVYTAAPVGHAVAQRLSVTLSIIVVALVLTIVVSVLLGVWAASRGGVVDKIAQGASLIGYIIPGLLLAIGLVWIFAVHLHWLPATGFTPLSKDPLKWARSITIPVVVLLIGGIAGVTAQVRGSMIDELRKDYVRTLRTRGISSRSVVLRHALRNAAGPALTVVSLQFISMFGGALIIENVFALPGFGSYSFNASMQGDIPVIMGVTAFSVMLVTVINLIVDLLNGWLNPKAIAF